MGGRKSDDGGAGFVLSPDSRGAKAGVSARQRAKERVSVRQRTQARSAAFYFYFCVFVRGVCMSSSVVGGGSVVGCGGRGAGRGEGAGRERVNFEPNGSG